MSSFAGRTYLKRTDYFSDENDLEKVTCAHPVFLKKTRKGLMIDPERSPMIEKIYKGVRLPFSCGKDTWSNFLWDSCRNNYELDDKELIEFLGKKNAPVILENRKQDLSLVSRKPTDSFPGDLYQKAKEEQKRRREEQKSMDYCWQRKIDWYWKYQHKCFYTFWHMRTSFHILYDLVLTLNFVKVN